MDLQNKSAITEDQVRDAHRKIEELSTEINKLKKIESSLISNAGKTAEDLAVSKTHKKFLDILSIGAGIKKPQP